MKWLKFKVITIVEQKRDVYWSVQIISIFIHSTKVSESFSLAMNGILRKWNCIRIVKTLPWVVWFPLSMQWGNCSPPKKFSLPMWRLLNEITHTHKQIRDGWETQMMTNVDWLRMITAVTKKPFALFPSMITSEFLKQTNKMNGKRNGFVYNYEIKVLDCIINFSQSISDENVLANCMGNILPWKWRKLIIPAN